VTISDEAPKTAIASILNPGRMLADGIPYSDYREAIDEIASLDEWFDFWARKGDGYAERGETAIAAGDTVSGGEWLWTGAICWHYAQFMWFHVPERRELGQRRKVELYDRAAPYLTPPAERLNVPFDAVEIPGFLRVPTGERPTDGWPCVVLLGGLESTKEESRLFEEICLRRGLATYAFDGPGQGELFFDRKAERQFERYATAVVDALEKRPELNEERMGVLGRSLGGYYALRSAAADGRFRACVAWGFFYDMSDLASMPQTTQSGFIYVAGGSEQRLREALDLSDVTDRLKTPTLLLNGRNDPIFPPRQMELVIDALKSAPVEVEIDPAGDHCCHNRAHLVRPHMADWLVKALAPRRRAGR
jgi:2,6-dihydroxypseudooxynicotine hydrolase